MRYREIVEAYGDLGKLTPAELRKGQSLEPTNTANFKLVEARVFRNVLDSVKRNDFAAFNAGLPSKGLHSLSSYSISQYASMRCFIGINNSSGFALNDDELVSVFSSQGRSGDAIVAAAIHEGARRLDCYALRQNGKITGPLFKLYARAGFKIDTALNAGIPGAPFAIVKGISNFVNEAGDVQLDDPRIIIFMRHP